MFTVVDPDAATACPLRVTEGACAGCQVRRAVFADCSVAVKVAVGAGVGAVIVTVPLLVAVPPAPVAVRV